VASVNVAPDELSVTDPDGVPIVVFRWAPAGPRAAVHVIHGLAEHALRYARLASALNAAGYVVYVDDHRGHGQTGARTGTLGDLGPRGMEGVVDAVHAVTRRVRAEHPGIPVYALGHSWGSFILYRSLQRYGAELDGALLTGTTHVAPGVERLGRINAAFEPARTPYDWLSRDDAEVDAYIADPFCGFESVPLQASPAVEPGSPGSGDDATIPRRLPVFVFVGSVDPVGGRAGGQALADHLRSLGLGDVTFRAYPGARHELFNETNRDEVTRDVLAWLDAHVARIA
jgi:alpha-beta hydrolase superfamily lysophospholipase